MATLQKFKHLATQCAVAGSPTRSPTTSPVIHLRRRKTLRMLLRRTVSGGPRFLRHDEDSAADRKDAEGNSPVKRKEIVVRHKLRDLFVSSPPLEERRVSGDSRDVDGEHLQGTAYAGSRGSVVRRGWSRSLRPLSATFRQRLRRRAWRPALLTIAE